MKNGLIFLFLLSTLSNVCGQGEVTLSIENNRNYEYINVHTDRDLYLTGEKIWYKIYLGNIQNNVNDLSVVAYVELTDSEGRVLLRNKNKCIDGMSHGSISIPKEINSSVYVLKAYTLWMNKFDDNLSFKKEVIIVNERDSVIQSLEKSEESEKECNIISEITLSNSNVKIDFLKEFQGQIVAQYRGIVLSKMGISSPEKSVDFDIQITKDCPIDIKMFDLNGNLLCKCKRCDEGLVTSTLDLRANSNVSPREKVDLELELKNSLGKSVKGNFSISIHRDLGSFIDTNENHNLYPNPISIVSGKDGKLVGKELTLYPESPESLPSISTNQINLVSGNKNTNQILLPEAWKELRSLVSEVNKSYKQLETQDKYEEIYLPFDNIYYPADYLALPNLEEFLIEIVDPIKFKRKKGKSSIAIRNTEIKNNVFVYNEAPLIVIDGFIYDNLDEVLSIDPSQIEKLTLSWKANTLSKVSLVKLADNGVLAIYTKNGIQSILKNKVGKGIYEQYHRSLVFPEETSPKNQSDRIPNFQEPLFWNPNVVVDGNGKIYFNTSDELGDFVIDVRGVSEAGIYITKQVKFTVKN
jgi:hypothetical protein